MLQKTMTLLLQIIQEFNQLKKINKKYIIIFFNLGERRRGGGQGGVLIIIWGLLALLRGPETETSKELGYNSLFLGQYFFYIYSIIAYSIHFCTLILFAWIGLGNM